MSLNDCYTRRSGSKIIWIYSYSKINSSPTRFSFKKDITSSSSVSTSYVVSYRFNLLFYMNFQNNIWSIKYKILTIWSTNSTGDLFIIFVKSLLNIIKDVVSEPSSTIYLVNNQNFYKLKSNKKWTLRIFTIFLYILP